MPFMIVAGDHAQNDMAGEEPDSWKSVLENEGFQVTVQLDGLGSFRRRGNCLFPIWTKQKPFQRQFHTVNRNSQGSWAKIPRKYYVTVTAGLPTCCLYFTALKCKAKLEHTSGFLLHVISLKGK